MLAAPHIAQATRRVPSSSHTLALLAATNPFLDIAPIVLEVHPFS